MNKSAFILFAVIAAAIFAAAFSPPIAQPLDYHHFADTRPVLGIPNGWNVLSNLPFLLVGLAGMAKLLQGRTETTFRERPSYFIFFLGVALTCFGSGYYHWHPDNETLVWDRLPMAIGFMSLACAVVSERIHERLGQRLLAPLIVIGLASVAWWRWTEHQGHGDLRWYLLVQFLPLILVPAIMALYPPRYDRNLYLLYAVGFYLLAKLLELGDMEVFSATGGLMSGHSLKHLAAAVAVAWILAMVTRRKRFK